MRAVVLYVCLYLVMLCGGHAVFAGTHHSRSCYPPVQGFPKKQVKLTSADQGNSILDDADLDLDEDYLNGHDDAGSNHLPAERYTLSDSWYLAFSPLLILNYYNKRFKTFPPFCGDSSPIYITQRVLRI